MRVPIGVDRRYRVDQRHREDRLHNGHADENVRPQVRRTRPVSHCGHHAARQLEQAHRAEVRQEDASHEDFHRRTHAAQKPPQHLPHTRHRRERREAQRPIPAQADALEDVADHQRCLVDHAKERSSGHQQPLHKCVFFQLLSPPLSPPPPLLALQRIQLFALLRGLPIGAQILFVSDRRLVVLRHSGGEPNEIGFAADLASVDFRRVLSGDDRSNASPPILHTSANGAAREDELKSRRERAME
eukprot:scaffold2808_cov255-Pinguiococcus_pyrenoidosus.AAC.2